MAAKVLIVEDELLIALEIQSILSRAGFAIAGCVASVDKALAVLEREECDAAVLDANLRGERIEAVALALCQRNKPFCFVSGYGRVYLPASPQTVRAGRAGPGGHPASRLSQSVPGTSAFV